MVLEMKPRALCVLGKHFLPGLHLQPVVLGICSSSQFLPDETWQGRDSGQERLSLLRGFLNPLHWAQRHVMEQQG